MNKNLLLPAVALLIAQGACIISRPTATPTAPPPPGIPEVTQPMVTQGPGSPPTQPESGGPDTATLPPPPPPGGGSLSLEILEPEDGAVVNTAQVGVIGVTAPNSVVTVNDDIIVVGEDGRFHSTVLLEEGPNLIEIIASDLEGNEASAQLTVFYEP